MSEEKKKGFFGLLFAPKKSGCCCGIEFEEIPQEDKGKEDPKADNENSEDKSDDN